MTDSTTAPNPTSVPDEMKTLAARMHGGWSVTEHHAQSPFTPDGGCGYGTEMFRLGPGGMSLISDYASQNPMGVFRGLGVFGWDGESGLYQLVETVNVFPGLVHHSGRWADDALVFDGTVSIGGQGFEQRHVFQQFTPDAFVDVISRAPAGEPLQPLVTITYERIG